MTNYQRDAELFHKQRDNARDENQALVAENHRLRMRIDKRDAELADCKNLLMSSQMLAEKCKKQIVDLESDLEAAHDLYEIAMRHN